MNTTWLTHLVNVNGANLTMLLGACPIIQYGQAKRQLDVVKSFDIHRTAYKRPYWLLDCMRQYLSW